MVAFVLRKVIICAAMILLTLPVWAGLPVRNMNPFVQFIGLPALQSGELLMEGEQQFSLVTSLNSHFVPESDEAYQLVIDGESYIGDVAWRQGFDRWELSVQVPYISYQKGFMDNFVDDWHSFFRLPDGGRAIVSDDQLLVTYQGKDSFLLDEPAQGVGDIRIQAGYQWIKAPGVNGAFFTSLKLPTGDDRKGLGSGGADLALFTTWAWEQEHWRQELQAGLLGSGQPDILPSMRRKVVVFGSAALAYVSSNGIALYVQYDANSRLYDHTDMQSLKDAHMLSAGWRVSYDRWGWSFSVTEDIDVDSAPDVGFVLGFYIGQ